MPRSVYLVLLSLSLVACGPAANSPERVAIRYTEAQLQGRSADMIALVTSADRAAAAQAPNTSDIRLYPGEADQTLLALLAKRAKVSRAIKEIQKDQAQVTVLSQVPDVNLSGVLLVTLFGGGDDEAAVRRMISTQVEQAPLKDKTETFILVREKGQWRIDTTWAEKTAAKKKEDAERARTAAIQKLKDDYETGMEQDLSRAQAALKQLITMYPNDTGWKDELAAVQTLSDELPRFTVNVRKQGIYQGQFRVLAGVKNGTALPLKQFTLKYTFMNDSQPVGTVYDTFQSGNWFSSRVLNAGGNTSTEATGSPPEGWRGQQVRAEVTSFEADTQ